MRNLPLIILGITAILVIAGVFFLTSKNSAKDATLGILPDAHTYFWSETCPHCKNVADFLATWPYTSGINLDKKEVSLNKANALLFTKEATKCNIPQDQMGVPLMITPKGECLNGDQPIIDYLKNLYPESTQSATPSAIPVNQ